MPTKRKKPKFSKDKKQKKMLLIKLNRLNPKVMSKSRSKRQKLRLSLKLRCRKLGNKVKTKFSKWSSKIKARKLRKFKCVSRRLKTCRNKLSRKRSKLLTLIPKLRP
jgi:hypothetical protein